MTNKETKKYIAGMKKFAKKSSSTKKAATTFLVNAGICTRNGNLTRIYK